MSRLITRGIVAIAMTLATGHVAAAGPVSFAKEIAPILQRSCQRCHRPPPGGTAPMSLVTYEDVRPWARAIRLRTSRREMPPWFIEKNVGIQRFKDDISLSDAEIETIAAWVDNGAPFGNPADLPPPLHFSDAVGWTIGAPDVVVSSPDMTVEEGAADWYGYLRPTPLGLTENRYVKAVEVREVRIREEAARAGRPQRAALGNSVVHHAGITTGPGMLEDQSPVGRSAGFNLTHEAGQNATIYPDALGVPLRAGSSLNWRVHTHSYGGTVAVRLDIAFKFHPKDYTPKYVLSGGELGARGDLSNFELDIPAGQDNVRFDALGALSKPAKLVTFEPHMHGGGKRMCLQAVYPNGIHETLNCAGYNHNWVKVYAYEDDAAPLLPAGTILDVIGWYDNSEKNPRIAEPRNWKGFGSRSIDDMMFFFGKFVTLTEEQFNVELAARQEKGRAAAGARNAGNR